MKKIECTNQFLSSLPSTQREAVEKGSKYYFDNTFCLKGHLSPKLISNNRCFICKRESTRKSATTRRRRLGQKIQKRINPLLAGETYWKLTATGIFKNVISINRKKNRKLLLNQVVCACGKKYWLNSYLWKKSQECRKCADKTAGEKNITHGLSHSIKFRLFFSAKKRAKKNNIAFNLYIDDITIPENCPILGIPLDSKMGMSAKRKPRFNAPSVDRINPEIGYTKENIIIMSYKANVLKNNGTSEEHLKIAEFLEKIGTFE